MELYYCDVVEGDIAQLGEAEGHHATKVMRRGVGHLLHFTDGEGRLYSGEVVEISKKGVKLQVISVEERSCERGYQLHIAIAPPKSRERFEWFLEKAVEIGVDRITPLIGSRSERVHFNLERSLKIVRAAAKQSLKFHFPIVDEIVTFEEFLKSLGGIDALKVIGHCNPGDKIALTELIKEVEYDKAIALIGPEGDFSIEEVVLAQSYGFQPISLGSSRFRVETAALMVVSALYLNGN